jgi:hypothetical protein
MLKIAHLALLLGLVPYPGFAAGPIWDAWYTVTIGKKIHYEYYHDHAELKGDRIYYQNHAWKKEEEFINEEQLGAFAQDNAELSPLFFNFHSAYRSTETVIDGTVKPNTKLITIKIRKGSEDVAPITKGMSGHSTFSSLFPVWLKRHISELKAGHSITFWSIQEDDPDMQFSSNATEVRLDKPDAFAESTHTRKLNIRYRGLQTFWWVDQDNLPLKVEIPQQRMTIERVAQEKAEHFLEQ